MAELFLLRDATAEDVPRIARLHMTTFVETHGGRGPTCETREWQWREVFGRPDGNWFCVVIEGPSRLTTAVFPDSSVRIPAMPITHSDLMAITIPSDADHRRSEATLGCTYHAEVIGIRQSFCCRACRA